MQSQQISENLIQSLLSHIKNTKRVEMEDFNWVVSKQNMKLNSAKSIFFINF